MQLQHGDETVVTIVGDLDARCEKEVLAKIEDLLQRGEVLRVVDVALFGQPLGKGVEPGVGTGGGNVALLGGDRIGARRQLRWRQR